jgi:hypothetical protein
MVQTMLQGPPALAAAGGGFNWDLHQVECLFNGTPVAGLLSDGIIITLITGWNRWRWSLLTTCFVPPLWNPLQMTYQPIYGNYHG